MIIEWQSALYPTSLTMGFNGITWNSLASRLPIVGFGEEIEVSFREVYGVSDRGVYEVSIRTVVETK